MTAAVAAAARNAEANAAAAAAGPGPAAGPAAGLPALAEEGGGAAQAPRKRRGFSEDSDAREEGSAASRPRRRFGEAPPKHRRRVQWAEAGELACVREYVVQPGLSREMQDALLQVGMGLGMGMGMGMGMDIRIGRKSEAALRHLAAGD